MLWEKNYPLSPLFHYFVVVQKHSPEDFLLCDVIGKPIQQPDGAIKWKTECRRSVAPWECPLLLVDMWRPKDGFERRFEIQRRDEYEREEREREKEREREEENCQGQFRIDSDVAFPTMQNHTDPPWTHRQAYAGGAAGCLQEAAKRRLSVVTALGTVSSGGASVI